MQPHLAKITAFSKQAPQPPPPSLVTVRPPVRQRHKMKEPVLVLLPGSEAWRRNQPANHVRRARWLPLQSAAVRRQPTVWSDSLRSAFHISVVQFWIHICRSAREPDLWRRLERRGRCSPLRQRLPCIDGHGRLAARFQLQPSGSGVQPTAAGQPSAAATDAVSPVFPVNVRFICPGRRFWCRRRWAAGDIPVRHAALR